MVTLKFYSTRVKCGRILIFNKAQAWLTSFTKWLATLRSLLNELARLTIVTTLKRASLFKRDLRVTEMTQGPVNV